jgi:hypothetical protein
MIWKKILSFSHIRPATFDDSALSSLLLPVPGFLLPLLLLRPLCEQERKKEWRSLLSGDATSVLLRRSARSRSTIMAKVQRQRRKLGGRCRTKSRRETPRSKKIASFSLPNFFSVVRAGWPARKGSSSSCRRTL